MGKGSKETKTVDQTQEQQTRLDPNSRRFVENFLRPLGMGGAATALGQEGSFFAGPTDTFKSGLEQLQGAGGGFDTARQQLLEAQQGIGGAGEFSFGVGGVRPDQIEKFLNPFTDEVVGGLQQNFDRQRQQVRNAAKQQATASGAFGGSREAILQAEGLGSVNRNEARQIAQTRSQGFNQALQAALGEFNTRAQVGVEAARARQQGRLQEAQLGLQAARQGANLGLGQARLGLRQGQALTQAGELERQIQQAALREPLFRRQQALRFANLGLGPTGQDTTSRTQGTTTVEQSGDLFGDLLGAGLTIGGLGGFGALGGLFGGGGGGGGSSPFVVDPGGSGPLQGFGLF